ncbi:alpha/beta fold hydrolase [Ornithinimicrobium avium]|uniref:Alpha/beta fold hydrolase n=1 Tax=Ornithinimicrobium avium TaxID=2283195 RepID=A0A345NJN9_9MICO|nr:alpha/beta fold hydrolase [Ornithinimicrobium avium]AXH95247.1 alpha/beta fold hydrolase [Ornithinimicrobium avium]
MPLDRKDVVMAMVLLHGLGAVGGVWRGVASAPDLPGHGRAAWEPSYSYEGHARAVLEDLPDGPVDVVGHSMGGVVALVLAALAPGRVRSVVGLGIKVRWSPEELAHVAALAQKPPRTFATRDEAAERFLKVAGLTGLVAADDPVVDAGTASRGDGSWTLAQDPRTFGVGAFDMPQLLGAAACRVVLARGEHDRLVSHEELAALVDVPVTLRGLGHNAHVEDLDAVLALLG